MRRSFCDFIDGVTSETMPEQRAARGSSGQRSARFRRNRIMAHVAIVLTSKSKPTAPPMPPTITTTGAAERAGCRYHACGGH
jgi:hypothetical protein